MSSIRSDRVLRLPDANKERTLPVCPGAEENTVEKLKAFCRAHREILLYLVFGVLTTLVSWIVYYGIMIGGRAVVGIPAEETTSARYLILYTAAQVIQWIAAVLFAFFTNKKWVFTSADPSASTTRQLGTFAGSRLVTFFLDYGITYGGTLALGAVFPGMISVFLLGKNRNLAELLSKAVAAVIVVIANYVFSKLIVFRRKKEKGE